MGICYLVICALVFDALQWKIGMLVERDFVQL